MSAAHGAGLTHPTLSCHSCCRSHYPIAVSGVYLNAGRLDEHRHPMFGTPIWPLLDPADFGAMSLSDDSKSADWAVYCVNLRTHLAADRVVRSRTPCAGRDCW